MHECKLNPDLFVRNIAHEDPDVTVFVVEDFLKEPNALVEYAREKAYFGRVGDDRTAYPGIRDPLPRPYARAMAGAVSLVYGAAQPQVHRCLLSLTTLRPGDLAAGQKIPHVDTVADDEYAAVHFLCGEPHGGTAFYRYLPRNLVRLRARNRDVVREMIRNVTKFPEEHNGYLSGDTRFFKQELVVGARFNRLVLYPSNLLHCALLGSPASWSDNVATGRLTVASFFRLAPRPPGPGTASGANANRIGKRHRQMKQSNDTG